MIKSILSPKAEVRENRISGKGTFAKEDIKKGEMIFIRGGHILTKDQIFYYTNEDCPDGYWPISDEYWLGATNEEEFEYQKVYLNHSCDANCGIRGEITCVAMRDIKKGEELTQDYGLMDGNDWSFKCICGSPNCRKVVTGYDWKIKELQDKYYDYFAQYLKEKIDNERKNSLNT